MPSDNSAVFERYSRQIMLDGFSKSLQIKLSKAKVAVIGLGATGSVSSEILIRSGVKNLVIVDRDFVELGNLQRQFLYSEEDIGMPKAKAAHARLEKIDSSAKITSFVSDINTSNIEDILKGVAIILDCTDNMETRFLINDYAVKYKIPWIYAAAVGFTGAVMDIVPGITPCFRCIFKSLPLGIETCETRGVLSTATALAASVQATEAIKIITGWEYSKSLMYMDIWSQSLDKLAVSKEKSCTACGKHRYEYLDEKKLSGAIMLCGKNTYQILPKGKTINLGRLEKKLLKIGTVKSFRPYLIHFDSKDASISVFSDGRAIVKNARSADAAKSIYSRFVGN